MEVARRRLEQRWVHSHEEDDGDLLVFRTSDFALPPSRGRRAMTLAPGGEVDVEHAGPDDRSTRSAGEWRLDGDLLTIYAPALTGTFQIETIDDGKRLVLRRRKVE